MTNDNLFRVWFRAADKTWICFHKDMAVDCRTANRVATNMLLGPVNEVAILHADSTISAGYVITYPEVN